jgi:F-box interacting protein
MPCCLGKANTSEENENRGTWGFLPGDIHDMILSKLSYTDLFRAKLVSKRFHDHINSDGFHGCRGGMHPQGGILTALHFSAGEDGLWRCAGYDLVSRSWKKLPPFHMLPRLDPALFKDHSICGARGIMCANVSSSSSKLENMIIFNPMTGRWKKLPPLNHPRHPVLMHMVVDPAGGSFKVIVAGSARAGHEHLSKVTEVFDSRTRIWTVSQELPGPLFALNEHQTGVYVNGVLYCIAFLEGEDAGKGVVAFSVEEGKWLTHLSCPLPNPRNLNIVQLVESDGEIALFSEIEPNPYTRSVEHRIDILEGRGKWRNVMAEAKVGSEAGLQVYPEFACVPFGEGKLCIFNTIVHTGVVYDIQSGNCVETLSSPDWSVEMPRLHGFHSMNPLTFTFEPSFKGNPETWLQSAPDLEIEPNSGPHWTKSGFG